MSSETAQAVIGLAEVHQLHPGFYKGIQKYSHVVGLAEPSDRSSKGTFGGTSASVNKSIQRSPPAGSEYKAGVWHHPINDAYSTYEAFPLVSRSISWYWARVPGCLVYY